MFFMLMYLSNVKGMFFITSWKEKNEFIVDDLWLHKLSKSARLWSYRPAEGDTHLVLKVLKKTIYLSNSSSLKALRITWNHKYISAINEGRQKDKEAEKKKKKSSFCPCSSDYRRLRSVRVSVVLFWGGSKVFSGDVCDQSELSVAEKEAEIWLYCRSVADLDREHLWTVCERFDLEFCGGSTWHLLDYHLAIILVSLSLTLISLAELLL